MRRGYYRDPRLGGGAWREHLEREAQLLRRCPTGPYAGQPFHNPQPYDLTADTANWSSYADSVLLGSIGIFSTDATAHRAKREEQRRYNEYVKRAYELLGTTRAEEHKKVAREIAPKYAHTGLQTHSIGEIGARCNALDVEVCKQAYGNEFVAPPRATPRL